MIALFVPHDVVDTRDSSYRRERNEHAKLRPALTRNGASIAASETVANSAIQGFIQALDVFVNTPRSDVVR